MVPDTLLFGQLLFCDYNLTHFSSVGFCDSVLFLFETCKQCDFHLVDVKFEITKQAVIIG